MHERRRLGRGVIGIAEHDGRYLMIQRSPHVSRPFTWCFPGGHIDPGETSRRAVIRELYEELSVIVEPMAKLGFVRVPAFGYLLAAWRVRIVGGEVRPNPVEVHDARWCRPEELPSMQPALSSNAIVFRWLGVD